MNQYEARRAKNTFTRNKKAVTIDTILEKKICVGCGACTVVCPSNCIDFVYGQRYNYPKVNKCQCTQCGKCLRVCPSSFLLKGVTPAFVDEKGRSYDYYITHAKDDQVRMDAASGGFITGIIMHLLNKGKTDGAIVAHCEGENPIIAESFIATNRESLLSSRGSKYAPVSNCTVLREVLEKPGRYIFVGTPCMNEALTNLQKLLPELKRSIVLSVGFVCGGMPSRLSTKAYIENDGGVNIKDVRRLCYRGNGWPGRFRVFGENDKLLMDRPLLGGSLTHVVGHDHYLRCENCLDHWAHFADIVVSDPWTEDMVKNEKKGRSAIMVRTERGKEVLNSAITSGDLIFEPISVRDFIGFNKHLEIDSKHPWHSWMLLYQIFFFGRVKNVIPLFRYMLRSKRLVGLRTTVKALFEKKYYY